MKERMLHHICMISQYESFLHNFAKSVSRPEAVLCLQPVSIAAKLQIYVYPYSLLK